MATAKCTIVSIWENGEVRVPGEIDLETGEVWEDEKVSSEGMGSLDRKYVSFDEDDIDTIEVCTLCGTHVIGFQGMWDDEVSGDYAEHYGCPECDGSPIMADWLKEQVPAGYPVQD